MNDINGINEEVVKPNLKRPHSNSQDESRLLTKIALLDSDISADTVRHELQKSPVALLNKLRRPLQYCIISQVGPSHAMCFTISVMVDGQQYVGSGPSKRLARAAAALKALAVILQPDPIPDSGSHDFTSDEHSVPNHHDICESECVVAVPETSPSAPTETTPNPPSPEANEITIINKSPINLIYEKYADVTFTCEPIDTDSCLRFKVICTINGQNFEGFGSSKRSAKLGAAKVALAALGINLPIKSLPKSIEMPSIPGIVPSPISPGPTQVASSLHQTLADRIAKAVLDKFNELMSSDTVHVRRKVLAGIVMTSGTNYEHMEVIAVSTGTKCVSGERLSTCGLAVNDCHAEVVSRRCFQEYLYDCLKDIADSAVYCALWYRKYLARFISQLDSRY